MVAQVYLASACKQHLKGKDISLTELSNVYLGSQIHRQGEVLLSEFIKSVSRMDAV